VDENNTATAPAGDKVGSMLRARQMRLCWWRSWQQQQQQQQRVTSRYQSIDTPPSAALDIRCWHSTVSGNFLRKRKETCGAVFSDLAATRHSVA